MHGACVGYVYDDTLFCCAATCAAAISAAANFGATAGLTIVFSTHCMIMLS